MVSLMYLNAKKPVSSIISLNFHKFSQSKMVIFSTIYVETPLEQTLPLQWGFTIIFILFILSKYIFPFVFIYDMAHDSVSYSFDIIALVK